jgi:hypothetical protein
VKKSSPLLSSRRQWLRSTCAIALGAGYTAYAANKPGSYPFRATSGDFIDEPQWDEKITVTVGPANADICGTTDKALQAAVDYALRLGGGTVRILPGTYRLRNAVRLGSGIRLIGSGEDSKIVKENMLRTRLSEDSDWFDQEITLEDASGFQVGDAVCILGKNPHTGGPLVVKRVLTARSGNRFKLDKGIRDNAWKMGEAEAATLFPLISVEDVENIVIEDLCIDGNRENNDFFDGNYGGCIFMHDANNISVRRVIAQNNNGDGIAWQICHDVVVEECRSINHSGLGFHPGSGSKRTVMRNNFIQGNNIGIFFCWGVQNGLAENNICRENNTGISIGHRDNGNIVRNNEVYDSGTVGILFRPERGEGFTATDNLFENNLVVNSGGDEGVAVDFQGVTAGNTFVRNTLTEKRDPAQRIGIRFGAESGENTVADNSIEGFAIDIQDLRKS